MHSKILEAIEQTTWDSPEQKTEFTLNLGIYKPEMDHALLLLSVMNKPSQFIGRVLNYGLAEDHCAALKTYLAQEEAEKAAAERKSDPDAVANALQEVKQKLEQGDEERKKHSLVARQEQIEIASKEWHEAVHGRNQAYKDWDAWAKRAVEEARTKCAQEKQKWDDFVFMKREALRKAKG